MSAQLDILLADQRRIDDQPKPAPKPVTQADHIIATGEGRRLAYRKLNPSADAAMVYGAQIGYLHGEIRRLDAELDSRHFVRNPALLYETVWCTKLAADVLAGFKRDFDGDIEVCEIVVGCDDVAAMACESVRDQVGDAAMAKHGKWLEAL